MKKIALWWWACRICKKHIITTPKLQLPPRGQSVACSLCPSPLQQSSVPLPWLQQPSCLLPCQQPFLLLLQNFTTIRNVRNGSFVIRKDPRSKPAVRERMTQIPLSESLPRYWMSDRGDQPGYNKHARWARSAAVKE